MWKARDTSVIFSLDGADVTFVTFQAGDLGRRHAVRLTTFLNRTGPVLMAMPVLARAARRLVEAAEAEPALRAKLIHEIQVLKSALDPSEVAIRAMRAHPAGEAFMQGGELPQFGAIAEGILIKGTVAGSSPRGNAYLFSVGLDGREDALVCDGLAHSPHGIELKDLVAADLLEAAVHETGEVGWHLPRAEHEHAFLAAAEALRVHRPTLHV